MVGGGWWRMLDLIERCCATLAALGYDLDALARIENELRYLVALLRGVEVRG